MAINELTKSTKVNRVTSQTGFRYIQISAFHRFPRKEQAVQDAGFARAVRAKDQRQWPDWNVLRFSKRFEVSKI